MSRISYSKYCATSLRKYFKYVTTGDERLKDINYDLVDSIVEKLSINDITIARSVYTSDIKEGFNTVIEKVAVENNVEINYVWKLIKHLEKQVALDKGLI